MLSAKEFTNKLYDDSAAMFEASKMQVKAYFESDLSKEELVDHFIGRMVNERMNLIEISAQIAAAPADACRAGTPADPGRAAMRLLADPSLQGTLDSGGPAPQRRRQHR